MKLSTIRMLYCVAYMPLLSLAASFKRWDSSRYVGALYNLNQGKDQNVIIVSAISNDGKLEYATSYPTGGKGGGQRGVDSLHAQDSIVVKEN